jgi:hypothetical protein
MQKNHERVHDSKILNRDSLKKGLIDYALNFVKKRDTLSLVIEEKERERTVHQDWDGDMPILI